MVTSEHSELTTAHLPEFLASKEFLPKPGTKLRAAMERAEEYLLAETFRDCGCWSKVAEILGIDRATVYRKARRHGLLKGVSH
jgi:transcriptional regulator of acetoin/glycerol metabolism